MNLKLKPSNASPVKKYLMKKGYKWIFNPPHAPHTGSAWQRMIGVVRQVLEAMLVDA